ncbi:SART-1 family-domain-containing protein [Pelagophyceae sp. CCMP2097]|nr:SART-1 family-domain-containing protein [Pelagophyceae sp. CCMP2097]
MLNKKFAGGFDGDDAAARLLASMVKKEEDEENTTDADGADGGLVLSSTTEFTARLHARLEERAAENASQVAAAEVKKEADEDKLRRKALKEDDSDSEMGLEDVPEDDEEEEEPESSGRIDFLHAQPLAQGGMASTLSLLKRTGDLQTKHVEETIGRARDQRKFQDGTDAEDVHPELTEEDIKAGMRDIKIEYRDDDGRLLTRREAFRQMCHKFHGKAPGKKKVEKMAERDKREARSINQGGSGSLAILQHAQKRTGQAYIPINNSTQNLVRGPSFAPTRDRCKGPRGHLLPRAAFGPRRRAWLASPWRGLTAA